MYFQLTSEIRLVGTDSKDGEAKPATLTYNFADKKITKGGIALQGYLEGKLHASLEFIYKVKQKSGKSFEAEKEMEKFAGLKIGAEADAFVSLSLGASFGMGDNWETTFYFSGVNLKVWAEFGLSEDVKPKFRRIIPDYKDTINIFKNKGETK